VPAATRGSLVQLAERAETTGWDGVFLEEDYVCYQGDANAPTCNT
jgi:alkanesulfonate monooxygenase SsuD/methylene tetrahydromethanopterin reductase-like flavin-dependent oxidoreductase (luciferase family)